MRHKATQEGRTRLLTAKSQRLVLPACFSTTCCLRVYQFTSSKVARDTVSSSLILQTHSHSTIAYCWFHWANDTTKNLHRLLLPAEVHLHLLLSTFSLNPGHTMMEARFGFLACSRHATMSGQLYGPHMTRIWDWENISSGSCWDPGPMDPRGVPWDQNFWFKIFILL